MIIAIEGMDKAGKRTQAVLLRDALQKRLVESALIDFPTKGTLTGEAVAAYFRNTARSDLYPSHHRHVLPCLAAADMWAASGRVESALRMRDVLVLNRSPASNLAYGRAAELNHAWLRSLTAGHPANGTPRLTVLLDMPVSESFRRVPENRDAFESDRHFLNDVRATYLSEARRHKWTVVRANRPAADVHHTILRRVMPRIREVLRQREAAL